MSGTTLVEVLRRSSAAMVDTNDDVTGALSALLASAVDALEATAGGILVQRPDRHVELLAATSHRVADLELASLQADQGPCLDAIRDGVLVHESGAQELSRRWPQTGPKIAAAGYVTVHAAPMTWRGEPFGGLNLFWGADTGPGDDGADTQAVADAATMLILSKGPLPERVLTDSLSRALSDRIVVEQAKGALAYRRGIDTAQAFDALVHIAEAEGTTLGAAARAVLDRAQWGTLT